MNEETLKAVKLEIKRLEDRGRKISDQIHKAIQRGRKLRLRMMVGGFYGLGRHGTKGIMFVKSANKIFCLERSRGFHGGLNISVFDHWWLDTRELDNARKHPSTAEAWRNLLSEYEREIERFIKVGKGSTANG